MRALITGAAGFVGRHTVDHLDAAGWDTVGVDLELGHKPDSFPYDALDFFRVSTARFDLVVHAAASSPHRAAIDGEAEHFARNLHLDAAMFDWAVRTGQGRVLYLSSSAAYSVALQTSCPAGFAVCSDLRPCVRHKGTGLLHESDIDLDDVEQPDAAYGWTKLTGERLAAAARSKGVPVTVVRPFSGYGEDQTENFPFRAIIERVKRREDPLTIWGTGDQVRDWIHIDDVVRGMLAVAESGTEDPVNLCTGRGASMIELAALASAQAGHSPAVELLADKPAGVAYRVGDPTLFHRFYIPRVMLDEGVARALACPAS